MDLESRVERLEVGVAEIKTILVRMEPALTDIVGTQRKQSEDMASLKSDMDNVKADMSHIRKLETDVARVDGRMTGIEGQIRQLPTAWTLASLIFAIFGAAFVLIRFAPGH